MVTAEQLRVCERYEVDPVPAEPDLKVGLALGRSEGPIHGLRHVPEGDTTGWYLWRGGYSDDPDFFSPLHTSHLVSHLPEAIPFLALPPGWRFLLAPGHEDVWHDASLLRTNGE